MTKPKATFLLAGHGSRNREGNDEIERFATEWRAKHPDWRIEVCFIEHADVLLNEGLDRAAQDAGRTPMPEGEDLEALASHHCTLCIYLSITLLHEVQKALRAAGWREDAPILVVQKASWPEQEKIVRGTLADIKQKCQAEKIGSQAMIVASPTLGAADWESLVRSKLYDPTFTHRFRKASETITHD